METKVGYLGTSTPNGPDTTTFGYMAAMKHYQSDAEVKFINFRTHLEICEAVAKKEIKFGVVAIENVIAGVVTETIYAIRDAEISGGVRVCGEVTLPIEFYYLRKDGVTDELPEKIVSHTVAIQQCSTFIQDVRKDALAKGKDIKVLSVDSTGEAGYIASTDPTVAAISSSRAEEVYHLKRIAPHSIVNHKKSMTRFWILGKEHANKTGNDKTALLIILRQDEAGALWRAMGCFSARETEDCLYRMKSDAERPNLLLAYPIPITGKRWEYIFLLEYSGHIDDPCIKDSLKAFADSGLSWSPAHFLGSYPSATFGSSG